MGITMIFTHIDDQYDNWHYYCYYYYPYEWPESNTNKEPNWREKSKGPTETRTKGGREKGKKWHILMGTLSPNIGSHRSKRGRFIVYCRVTIHTLYTRIGTSSSSSQERKRMCSGIIIIRMVPIGQYIIHRTRYTILIESWHEWLLHCHSCTKSSFQHANMTPSYITNALYQYTYL